MRWGHPQIQINIIINIFERLLPQGLEAWRQVAAEYQRESDETTLQENWIKKLCNHMQKLKGKPSALQDHIF
jgi:hypothetical protein